MPIRDPLDPKDLIAEAYRIEGITAPECRSIFLDWALSTGVQDHADHVRALLARHGVEGHPMTDTLRAALDAPERTGRRGGARARRAV